MIRTGKVIQAKGNSLQVCFSRLEACESCGMCGSGRQDSVIELVGNAREGDTVDVQMPDARVLKVSALTYLLPLAGLIAGLSLGMTLFPAQDFLTLAGGLAGLALSLSLLKLIDRRLAGSKNWQPRITAVYPAETAEISAGYESAGNR